MKLHQSSRLSLSLSLSLSLNHLSGNTESVTVVRTQDKQNYNIDSNNINNNETGSRSPCMRPRSDPLNFGPIERGEKQTNNID